MPKAVHRSGCRDKHNWPRHLTPQSIMPSLNRCDLPRHVGVNNLHKVVTRQRRGRELNSLVIPYYAFCVHFYCCMLHALGSKCNLACLQTSNCFAHRSGCEVLWWVCLSVCLSVCLRGCLQNHARDFTKFFVHIACVCGSDTRSSSDMFMIGCITCRRETELDVDCIELCRLTLRCFDGVVFSFQMLLQVFRRRMRRNFQSLFMA